MNHTSLKKTQNKSIYNKNMPKRITKIGICDKFSGR